MNANVSVFRCNVFVVSKSAEIIIIRLEFTLKEVIGTKSGESRQHNTPLKHYDI